MGILEGILHLGWDLSWNTYMYDEQVCNTWSFTKVVYKIFSEKIIHMRKVAHTVEEHLINM